ncbi:cell division protein FtsI/penicillin-binding protein 2 [Cytobacillus oceanisediminis]|uniref:serine-type D-Ala-D-Ala carboxypeptidase n=1 Tax=Cytobacillus oceanisediminis TaxID=665099 RepID=A0A2V2ZVN7_9BACI|nr:penicillin-binding protein 2 [Cytobacillus oceanisediminis]PWW28478.1 cell division protein FtsI/penicillin-binding protein 2 [Cytobacillus oceanisediminis]
MGKKKKKSHVPFRVNLLFFAVFILFSLLILRLGVVQIVNGETYKKEVERTEDVIVSSPVPRGRMLDRNHRLIVDNIPKSAITYTNRNAKQEEMVEVAERLAVLIDKKPDKVRERDKKDFWIMKNPEAVKEKITEKEWELFESKKLTDKQIYEMQLERITDEDLNQLSEQDLEVLAIYREFTSGYAMTPQIVKNESVTPEEYAAVSENLQYLPGVNTTTDWDRTYAFGNTLQTVLGKVTDSNEGLPEERVDYFLARDYSRNERVGKSYLEMQYEDVLHGQKSKERLITKKGEILGSEMVSDGQRGKDLVLTIDMDLQRAVEKILEEEIWAAKRTGGTYLMDRAFVVLMDPHTGEVLTMAGKMIGKDDDGKTVLQDYALGTIASSYNVGSSVKGATVLTGYKTGAITPGTTFLDAPMKIAGTPQVKKSWFNFQAVMNETRALRISSNVYMFKTAVEIADARYAYDQPLGFKNPRAFEDMRDSFGQFGLGVRTGIDLPNEMAGYEGPLRLPGFLLDLAIGQYDTYTPMQMAQYISTIANGGYRIQPRLVKEIREPSNVQNELGPIWKDIQPTVLNTIDVTDRELSTVKEGLRQVMQHPEGTAYRRFADAPYSPAGKTGTAEAFYDGPLRKKGDPLIDVMNLSLVAYAPHNNPEIAMSVIVPWAYQGRSGHTANYEIGRRVLDTYFALKKQRMSGKKHEQLTEEKEENTETEVS